MLKRLAFACIVLLTACGGGGGSAPASSSAPTPPASEPFSYRAPTSDELAQVQSTWAQRDLSAQNVSVAYQLSTPSYQVTIYTHRVGANTHAGAIVVPLAAAPATLPVLLIVDGLDQSNPSMDLAQPLFGYRADAVLVVPAFRGRTLRYNGQSFAANGDFCDAYDGATDDTIALLNVAAATTPRADMSRVVVQGYSRGGNVALLMGMRDRRVRTVLAGAGPTDFYRQEVQNHYGSQYTCQFFTGRTEAAARQRMLASSPLRFALLLNVTRVSLFHGELDSVVPTWNSTEMRTALQAQGAPVSYTPYPGSDHTSMWANANFIRDWNQAQVEALR